LKKAQIIDNNTIFSEKEFLKSQMTFQKEQNTLNSSYMLLKINQKLTQKYIKSEKFYQSKITSDIMYNEPHHLVSVFKDYLIFDDFSEYIKRFYNMGEQKERLVKIFDFY